MCGRFSQTDPVEVLAEKYRVDEVVTDLPPSYNIAPGDRIISVIEKENRRVLTGLFWGLTPRWRAEGAASRLLINARSETLHEKPTFRNAFRKGRCLVIASGFYEWQKKDGVKQPVYITMKRNDSFAMAGIFEPGVTKNGDEALFCVILTTEANETLRDVHNRMPVILAKSAENLWLNTDAPLQDISKILVPTDSSEIRWHRVSPIVNSPRNNSPECIVPI